MPTRPVVLLHGYSDTAEGLQAWKDELIAHERRTEDLYLAEYVSLSNEITVKDIAEGFDRALRERTGLRRARQATGRPLSRRWTIRVNSAVPGRTIQPASMSSSMW
jgi:hypothetical protein